MTRESHQQARWRLSRPDADGTATAVLCACVAATHRSFSLTCSHKRSYGYTASYGPDQEARLLPQSPKPAVIGTGLVAGTLDLLSPPFAAEEILYLDEHRPAHKVGTVYGAM
jgi:hypothetical protein